MARKHTVQPRPTRPSPRHRLPRPHPSPTPPPAATLSTTTLHRHAPLPRLPAEEFKIVFSPGGGLDLRTTTNGALLQILCTLATIDYATARTADRVRINPYNNSLTVSTPSEPRARLYLQVSELCLGPTSHPLRAYMAAPDNALRGIIYNAVDSQAQDEVVQDLQSMNVNTPYAIADACQMGRSKSILITFVDTTTLPSAIVFNCGIYRCHPFRPKAEACTNCWAPGTARTCARSPSPPSVIAAARLTRQSSPRHASPAATCAREPTSQARVRASSGSTGTASGHLQDPASPTSATHRAHPLDLLAFPPPLCFPWCPVCQPPPLRLLPTSAQHHTPPRQIAVYCPFGRPITLSTVGGRLRNNPRLRNCRWARLASDMEEHCSSLLRQQWGQTYNRMAGNLGLRDTWSLLRVLLDPTHTKASQRKELVANRAKNTQAQR
ncbi:hypothetical protein HPB49_026506 [Dermacentor silvarum]|nr:hypothetical protein HPB49_026506 [Dermacentor silvarum]